MFILNEAATILIGFLEESERCMTGNENGLVRLKIKSYFLNIGLMGALERMGENICMEKD